MRQVPSRRALFLGGASSLLLGATWARDGNGRAYNTPTPGADLLTNGDFEIGDPPTAWTSANSATLAATVDTRPGSAGVQALSLINGGANQGFAYKTFPTTIGTFYLSTGWQRRVTANATASIRTSGHALLSPLITATDTAWSVVAMVGRATSLTSEILLQGATATLGHESRYDDFSLKSLSLPTLHAYTLGAANNLPAIARVNALTTGTQAGAFALVDSNTNPQNGIYAYHDGTGVTLDKLVSGTWSNVNARVTVAFSADADLEIRPLGSNQFDLYYGGTKRGATATISDASIVNNLYYGLFSTYSGNLFSRFTLGGNVIPFGF